MLTTALKLQDNLNI